MHALLFQMIEHQTACAFQAATFILEGRVIDHVGDPIVLAYFLDDIHPTFASTQH